jgi:hypothetical protein
LDELHAPCHWYGGDSVTTRMPEVVPLTSPMAAVATLWMAAPWYVYMVAVALGPAVYLARWILIFALGWKALDKVEPSRVADLMVTITGRTFVPLTRVTDTVKTSESDRGKPGEVIVRNPAPVGRGSRETPHL